MKSGTCRRCGKLTDDVDARDLKRDCHGRRGGCSGRAIRRGPFAGNARIRCAEDRAAIVARPDGTGVRERRRQAQPDPANHDP